VVDGKMKFLNEVGLICRALIHRSQLENNRPPVFPDKPTRTSPRALATSMAAQTLRALPDVLMPTNKSPGRPSPQTSCAKTNCGSTSLAKAVPNDTKPVRAIAGSAPAVKPKLRRKAMLIVLVQLAFIDKALEQFACPMLGVRGAAPFPHRSILPPRRKQSRIISKARITSIWQTDSSGRRCSRSWRRGLT